MNHFLIGFWHVTKSEFYTTSNNQLSGWTQRKLQSTSQSQNCPPKRFMVTVWCLAAGLIHYSFLNPSKIITSENYAQQIDQIHWKLQCLQPTWVKRMGPILLMTTPSCMSHNQHFKSWMNWATTFASSDMFTWPLTNQLLVLQHLDTFLQRKTLPQPTACRKCFPSVNQILRYGFLCYRNKQTYFLLAKMWWLWWFLFCSIKMYLSLVIMS